MSNTVDVLIARLRTKIDTPKKASRASRRCAGWGTGSCDRRRPDAPGVTILSLSKSRTRIALAGAALSAAFLLVLALSTRAVVRSMTFADIDEELYTLAAALGSSFELEGLEESRRDALRAGLEANAFEFRLANHSAILFKGDTPSQLSGNLLRTSLPGGIGPTATSPRRRTRRSSLTAGRRRICRFLVTRLSGNAKGSTLVLFRSIGLPSMRSRRLDRALAAIVLLGIARHRR